MKFSIRSADRSRKRERRLAVTCFLERRVLWPIDKQLPEARARLMAELERVGRL